MVPVSSVSKISAPADPPADTRISGRSSPLAEENAVLVSERNPADFAFAGLTDFPAAYDPDGRGAGKRLRKCPFAGSIFPGLRGGPSAVLP